MKTKVFLFLLLLTLIPARTLAQGKSVTTELIPDWQMQFDDKDCRVRYSIPGLVIVVGRDNYLEISAIDPYYWMGFLHQSVRVEKGSVNVTSIVRSKKGYGAIFLIHDPIDVAHTKYGKA